MTSVKSLLLTQHRACIASIDNCLHAPGRRGVLLALGLFRANWVAHTRTEEQYMCDISYEARSAHISDHALILEAIDATLCQVASGEADSLVASENPIVAVYDRLMLHLSTFDVSLENSDKT